MEGLLETLSPRASEFGQLAGMNTGASVLGAPDDAAISYQRRALTAQEGERAQGPSFPVIQPPAPCTGKNAGKWA